MHKTVDAITQRIISRSRAGREAYLARVQDARSQGPARGRLSCGNLAHGFAACGNDQKAKLSNEKTINIGIVSAYNDMLSAHQPYLAYPEQIKAKAASLGATAQFAGGVPAMCDGVTQGRTGMELSLLSRDVIAMSTAIALSHDMFDAVLCLGVCDKIVPGLLIGALSFAYMPIAFVPAGPMPSGLPNAEKARVRQLYAEGKVGRKELLEAESQSYHSPGTCTFYGTANSNQMLMEMMGLHLPGSSFVNPGTPLRSALTDAVTEQVIKISGPEGICLADIIDEKAMVNGVVGLLATGGSTNHAIHLVAMARAAGIELTWQDMSELSEVAPLLCRIYPNGLADVNHFQAAGGMGYLMKELMHEGLIHADVTTIMGKGLEHYIKEPKLNKDSNNEASESIAWHPVSEQSLDSEVLRPVSAPFSPEGGLKLLSGNLGKAVIKVSAVDASRREITAPALVFDDQDALLTAYKEGKLERDFVAVIRYQGPKANGMPELHKLTPTLGVLQDKGFKVALVTDGRMSGASGKVPAAIHLSPESVEGGPIGLVRDGDVVSVNANSGELSLLVDEEELRQRIPLQSDLSSNNAGMGRELFAAMRHSLSTAESGATILPASPSFVSSESDSSASDLPLVQGE